MLRKGLKVLSLFCNQKEMVQSVYLLLVELTLLLTHNLQRQLNELQPLVNCDLSSLGIE